MSKIEKVLFVVLIVLGIIFILSQILLVKTAEAKTIPDTEECCVVKDEAIESISSPTNKSGSIIKVKPVYNILKLGDTGEYVKIFQRIIGAKVDGIFGEETWNTWLAYQLTIK